MRNPASPEVDLVDAGKLQQIAYLRLSAHGEWLPGVLGAVPDWLRPVVQNNYDAMHSLGSLNGPVGKLPDWKIVAAPAIEVLRGYYAEAEAKYGVRWYYLAAIHFIETDFSRIASDSVAGAEGPMQFIPSTWAAYGQGDVHDTHAAILAAARYLKASGAPGNMNRAIYAYNPDDRYVTSVTKFAANIAADDRAFTGYYHWRVYVPTKSGPVFMEPSPAASP
jgi:soluble lytic murein transglycosylase-like protein